MKQIVKSILMSKIFAFRLGSIRLVQHQLAGLRDLEKYFNPNPLAAKNKMIKISHKLCPYLSSTKDLSILHNRI